MTARAGEAGFTLIEALVAMVVLAVGAVSLLTAAEAQTVRISALADRTAARWVAEYRLTELRLGVTPDPGPVDMLGRRWSVVNQTQGTSDPDLDQVTVRVAPQDQPDRSLVVLTGYLDTAEPPQ